MLRKNPLAYVLGGGRGARLYPLTRDRAKPAVPFGGSYRVIDFVLSNLYHSGIRKICVLTQYESRSLDRHIKYGWYPRFGIGGDEFLTVLPARQGDVSGWYRGTADAINQNVRYIIDEEPNIVDVFGGDHIYLMDISQMNDFHLQRQSDLTISAIPVKRELAAGRYGVLVVDDKWQLQDFEEKLDDPTPIPGNDECCLASMGNYVFKSDILLEEIEKDANKETTADNDKILQDPGHFSSHDFGFDLIPAMLKAGRRIFVYNFMDNSVPGTSENERGFWRDIGDLDQFYEANMEVRSVEPPLNLYNTKWQVLTYVECPQPAKFVGGGVLESIVANGVIISHSLVERSVLSYNVRMENAEVTDSILLGDNYVGKRAVVRNAIVDRGIRVPDGETIGVDRSKDEQRGFTISPKGITVVPRKYEF